MNVWDIPIEYLLLGSIFWIFFSVIFIWRSELIGAALLALFFFSQVILDLFLGGIHIPNGQLVIILFGPLLLISIVVRQKAPVRVRNLIPWVLLGFAVIMSIVWNKLSFWEYKSQLVPLLFGVLIYLAIPGIKELRLLFLVFFLFVVMSTVVAGLQYMGFESFYLPSQLKLREAGGFRRGVGLANHFWQTGLYCGATMPLAVMGIVNADGRVKKLLWAVMGLFAISGVTFTTLRAAFVGGVIGGMVSLFMWDKKKAIPYFIIIFIISSLLFLSVPFLKTSSEGLIKHTSTLDSSALRRPELARMGLALWKKSPLFGVGPKGVKRYYGPGDAHNSYVNVLGDHGIFAFAAFMSILVLSFMRLKGALRRLTKYRNEVIGLTGALICVYMIGIVHSVNYIPLFWLFPALVLSLDRFREEDYESETGQLKANN